MSGKWRVYTLDVWGHTHSECGEVDDGCLCRKLNDAGEYEDTGQECHCDYSVNDRCSIGTIETSDLATEVEIWCCLVEAGIAKGLISRAEFESDDADTIYINDAETGRPVFALEAVSNQE